MKRRDIIKRFFFGAITAKTVLSSSSAKSETTEVFEEDADNSFQSKWHLLPDMVWTGEDLWAQRLQDWCVKDGELCCLIHGADRTVNILTHQLSGEDRSFTAEMILRFVAEDMGADSPDHFAGFRLGLKGSHEDYRSAIFTGKGIDAGIGRNGKLFIGSTISDKIIDASILNKNIKLVLFVESDSSGKNLNKLSAFDMSGNLLAAVTNSDYDAKDWQGNIAMVSHYKGKNEDKTSLVIKNFLIKGEKLEYHPEQIYGPVYFAQYSLNERVLKLTAQLAPTHAENQKAELQVKKNGEWKTVASSSIHPLSRTAGFRIEKWDDEHSHLYRVLHTIDLRDGIKKHFTYEGIIAAEPVNKEKIKALAFSCNWDFGFPDNEVVINASKHEADIVFFLGDQFYEANGGFSIQTSPLEKATLDYLRKWYMFGWSYRELFRNRPMAALPDDHDMYHGNIWGAGGRATILKGTADERQDSGGYKMPAQWVNMAQLTQTSHMPDAYDPTPVLQGIKVYYNTWDYAGISFGIIEDRKFKSPPKDILPADAKVYNGYAENPGYDHSKEKNTEAHLLGERQIKFLKDWSSREDQHITFKVLISATPFCCLQTLPAGTKNDRVTPGLPIPAKGEYVNGDLPTQDMDSNGWPHNRRDEVLSILKKKLDLHIAGDQHLPSVVQYGVEEFADNAYCFSVPALCNIWPRRWWPPVDEEHQPLPGQPKYTGNFKDGFGNKMTVHAVASPFKNGRQPAMLYDRVTGYGVVEFDKRNKTIILNCWPRYADPLSNDNKQYTGWPVSFKV